MKLPKIKIKKLSKKTKLQVLRWTCVVAYSLGASFYGYINYLEGQEDEWRYISDSADKSETGAVIFHEGDMKSEDNMYWVAGRKKSKEIWESIPEMAKKENEQENS